MSNILVFHFGTVSVIMNIICFFFRVDSKINGEATVEEIDNGAKRKNETVEKIAK